MRGIINALDEGKLRAITNVNRDAPWLRKLPPLGSGAPMTPDVGASAFASVPRPSLPSSTANAQAHEHEPPRPIPACRCNEYRPQRGQFASGGRPANLLQRVRTDAMRWP